MKRIAKIALAILLSITTILGIVGCKANNEPTWIDKFLCVEHTYGAGVVERAATCQREGRIKYTCTECGSEKTETLVKIAHTPYTVPAREATCGQTGYSEYTACAVCGVEMSTKTVLAKTACTGENVYYVGGGVYECSLCGRKSTDYTEERMVDGEFYQAADYYRFYLDPSNPDATASIRIRLGDEDGKLETDAGAVTYLKNIYIGFEGKKNEGYIYWEGSNGKHVSADITVIGSGADYIDVNMGLGTFEVDVGEEATLTIIIDIETRIYAECSNGGYVVMQQGRSGD